MKKILWIAICTIIVTSLSSASFAQTTAVDALINKLVEKQILTKQEARELKSEVMKDEKIVMEEGVKQNLPSWVNKLKLKGDLRTRYQYERKKNDSESRGRARVRYRLGIEADIVKNIKVGAGFASGSSDPRSTNQTLENSFETPDIRLDYAYAQWQPLKALKVIAGKFARQDYLWAPTDMLWDGDVNPNGIAVNYQQDLIDNISGFANLGYLIIDEKNRVDNIDDPFIKHFQAGLKYKNGNFDATTAGTYYAFNNLKGNCPEWTAGTNSGVTAGSSGACTGALIYDYDSYGASTEFGVKKLFGGLPLGIDGRIALFGDYIYNPDPEFDNAGWAYGVKFGREKLSVPGDWQVKYSKVVLGRDAFPDFLPDSDRLGGKTNVLSHEVALEYLWKENITLGLDYYKSDNFGGSKDREQLVQGDVVFKF